MSDNPQPPGSQTPSRPTPAPPVRRRQHPLAVAAAAATVFGMFVVVILSAIWWIEQARPGAFSDHPPGEARSVDGEPPSGWNLVFDEPFDDNTHLWKLLDFSNEMGTLTTWIEDGEYHAEASVSTMVYWLDRASDDDIYTDSFITVDARIASNVEGAAVFGILFRAANEDNHYAFEVDDTGSISIEKEYAGEFNYLLHGRYAGDLRSDENNTLGVLAVGPHLTFYVNGTEVAQLDDSTHTAGRAGILIFLYEPGQEATVVFDNLKVYTP